MFSTDGETQREERARKGTKESNGHGFERKKITAALWERMSVPTKWRADRRRVGINCKGRENGRAKSVACDAIHSTPQVVCCSAYPGIEERVSKHLAFANGWRVKCERR